MRYILRRLIAPLGSPTVGSFDVPSRRLLVNAAGFEIIEAKNILMKYSQRRQVGCRKD
jgi:hypothetical protein